MGFDLLAEDYRMGDRNKKETDKYLFLDTLLAAREKLYLSYIGQSIKDNTEFPPSIVIDTLLNYLGSDAFLVRHPLQGFSSNYQKDDKRLFTYLYADAASSFKHGEIKGNAVPELSVYTFVSFFENPVEWYYKNVLNINFEETDDTLPETELFSLDNLERWIIKNELLRVNDNEIDLYYANAIKEGKLPLKNSGRVTLDEIVQEIAIIKSGYQSLTLNREEKSVDIDLTIDNFRITGAIDSVYGDEYIAYTFSDNSKHWVAACLKTLMLCATNKIKAALFLDRDGGKTAIPVLKAEDARSKIKLLLEYLNRGSQEPLKFTLKASEAALKKTGDIEKVIKAIKSEAYGNRFSGMEPDPYIKILYEEGYFEDFDEKNLSEIKVLSGLLNLYTV
jgi:exodeoxyribonuclease V gamma subunit